MKKFFFGKTVTQHFKEEDVTFVSKVYPFSATHAGKFSNLISTVASLVSSNLKTNDQGQKELSLSFNAIQQTLTTIMLNDGIELLSECVETKAITVDENGKEQEHEVSFNELPQFLVPEILEVFAQVNFSRGRWKKWAAPIDKIIQKLSGQENLISNNVSQLLSEME